MTATCLGYIFLPPTDGLRSPKTQNFLLQNRHLKFLWWSKIWKLRIKKVYLYFRVHLNYRDMAGPVRKGNDTYTSVYNWFMPGRYVYLHGLLPVIYYVLFYWLQMHPQSTMWTPEVSIIVRWFMILSNYSCNCHKHPTHPINHTQPNYKWTWLRFGTPKQ